MTLVFKETKSNGLVKNTKYITMKYVCDLNCVYYTGIFTGYTYESHIDNYLFVASNFDNATVTVVYTNTKTDIRVIKFYDELKEYYYVDFQKEKIQNAMELRAVNIILQRIIGDNIFKY